MTEERAECADEIHGGGPWGDGPEGRGYIGVDVGTSGCKAVLLDGVGCLRGDTWEPYDCFRSTDGEVTQDAEDWLGATERSLRTLAATAAAAELTIEALAATAPAHTMVLLGKDSRPVARPILPYDTRSAGVAERILATSGPGIFDRTFVRVGPSWTLPQLVWFRESSPEAWARVHMALSTKDFITYALTGARSTDASDAAGTALYDQRAGHWAEDICGEAGVSLSQLAPILPATGTAGRVTRAWGTRTGIPAGTPVAVGATDTACELLSLNITRPGDGLVKIASTGTVVAVLDQPRPDPRIMTYPYLDGGWYMVAATNAAASAYQWLRGALFGAHADEPWETYAQMDLVASGVRPGSDGMLFLPFLTGERSPHWDSELRAAFLGVSAAHDRSHFCRAVLEGVAFSLRECRDLLASLGVVVPGPYFTGGGAQSHLWRTILASILRTPGRLVAPQGPAIGAAMLAAASVQGTMPVAKGETVTIEPDATWVDTYERVYQIYGDAVRCLGNIDHALVREAMR